MAGRNADRRKRCSRCGDLKDKAEFDVRSNRASGLSSSCKACEKKRRQVRYDALVEAGTVPRTRTPEQVIAHRLWSYYRMTPEQYDALLAAQGGVCAICKKPETARNPQGEVRRYAVDHDHACCPGAKSCGECVRGLLCQACNVGLGCFLDSLELLGAAQAYVAGGRHRWEE